MELPNFVKNDQWLEPFAPTIISRLNIAREKEHEILRNVSLSEFAQGHKWYGLHKVDNQWIVRDW
ncbi:MAG: hypothetical protein Q8M67_01530, partial [Bacteroidota bacterium]|nr:hypothetical protein [Bacteroidota bacterium]